MVFDCVTVVQATGDQAGGDGVVFGSDRDGSFKQAVRIVMLTNMLGQALSVSTLGNGVMLVSAWKPFLVLLPLLPWLWLVTKVFDKHCSRFHLAKENWNLVHLCVGLIAVLLAFAMPIAGEGAIWAGLGAMIVLLAIDVTVFTMVVNKDDRVPEEHHLTLDFSKYREARAQKAADKKQGKAELVLRTPDKQLIAVPMVDSPEFELRTASEALYLSAVRQRATQIEIAPVAGGVGGQAMYAASYMTDGVRTQGDTMPPANAMRVIDFWKHAAGLDVAERRKRQSGDTTVEQEGSKKKLRVVTIGSQAGVKCTMLIEPEAQVRRKPSALGLLEPQMEELKALTGEEEGVVLLAAPLDGGRTTTFYTVVKMHDAYTRNIQTVEIEPQDTIEGVKQNIFEVVPDGPEFSTFVRSVLRRDPDVVGVAELPDASTAKEIAKADVERTRTYVSLRADNALVAVAGWVKAVGDLDQGSKCLRGVVAQRLVRKLCTNCRVPYPPSPEMLKKLGLPGDRVKQLFKKGGQVLIKNKPEICPMCGGSGYHGQEGVFEIMRLTAEDRALIKAGDMGSLRTELRKRNTIMIQQAALKKAVDGVTSVEELMRVMGEGSPSPQRAQSAPAGAAS